MLNSIVDTAIEFLIMVRFLFVSKINFNCVRVVSTVK